MGWRLKEELAKFRRYVLKLIPRPPRDGATKRIVPEKPRHKKCPTCRRTLPNDFVYFVETQGGNTSSRCRRCQRTGG